MKNKEKDQVIATLADKELKPAQKFNALLGQFRAHPQHPASTMRHLNAAGFSPMNLSHLEYDIKKLYGIKDSEVASFNHTPAAPQKTQEEINAEVYALIKETFAKEGELDFTEKQKLHLSVCELAQEKNVQTEPAPVPEFSKGIAGNKEMADWLKERKVEHKAKKKAELLAEVEKQLHKEYDEQLTDYMGTLKVWAAEYEAWLADQEAKAKAEDKSSHASQDILEGTIEELQEYLSGETNKEILSGLVGEELIGKNRAGAIEAIESRIDELLSFENNDNKDAKGPAPESDVPVNYDGMEYNDLKAAAAERAKETGEAPADQKKATLLEYLKKKV